MNESDIETLTVNRDGLAKILKRSPKTIRRQVNECPERLPPHVAHTKPRIWLVATVHRWLSQKESAPKALAPLSSNTQATQAVVKRVGRPRKQAANPVKGDQE